MNRIHIWQATIPMLKENLFFGVGQDAFGLWFPKYRSASPLLIDIQTEYYDNAHNIFLNYLANSGIFVFVLFLFFTIFVGYHSVLILKNQSQNLDLVSLVCIWFALQAQSLISVDNIALNVWNWIISGAIISASVTYSEDKNVLVKSKELSRRLNTIKIYRSFLVVPFLFSFLYISPTINLEHKIKFLTSGGGKNLAVTDFNSQVNGIYQKALTARYPEVRNYVSVLLFKANREKEALDLTRRTTEKFPRSILAFELLAQMYEKQENVMLAISAWEKALNLDPANTEFERNLLKLKLNSIP
jgi:tetratricopeptide (TPR) repeat protein